MTNYRESMSQTLEYMAIVRERKILERELTDTELKRREEIAKELPDSDFKSRYGEKWMEVKMATATKMAKKESVEQERDDLIEAGGLSPAMISKLKKAYSGLKKVDPTSPAGKKMTQMMDKMNKEQLVALVKADINFISLLAVNRLIRMGMNAAQIRKLKEEQKEFTEMLERWELEEGKPGLWDNIHKKRKEGRPMRKKGEKGAPTDQDFKDSQEEVAVDEKKDSYELYHKDFTSAMKHAYAHAKRMYGISIDPKEIDDKVATGPRKPGTGKTNKYRLKGDKGAIQVQVYNKGGSKPYELNMYKEEVDLDEGSMKNKLIKTADLLQKMIKPGDPDRQDYAAVRDHIEANNMKVVKQIVMKMDTVPKERIAVAMAKGLGKAEAEKILGIKLNMGEEVEVDEQLAKIKGNTPADGGRRAATQDDIDRAEKKGDKKLVKKLKEISPNKQKSDVIVMKKGPTMKSVVGASAVKKAEKEGFKIQYALLKTGQKVTDPRGIMKAIKSADKLGIGEEVELDEEVSVKDFDALKKGDTVTVEYKSAMSSGKGTFAVTAKNKVAKGKVEKVTLKSTKNPGGVKYFLYKRNNKVGFAQGDMGASVVSFKKEEVELDEKVISLAKGMGKEVVNDGGEIKLMKGGKVISSGDYDRGAGVFFMNVKGKKGQVSFKEPKDILGIKEAWEIGTDEYRKYLETLTPMEGARRDAYRDMKKSGELDRKDDEDDVRATKDDRKAANKNILQQLKKTIDTKGKSDIEFLDKKKNKVPYKVAVEVIKKYMGMRRSTDKLKFQQKVAKSYKDMLAALKENYELPKTHKETILDRIDTKIQERKNG